MIPYSNHPKLYYYWDLLKTVAWAKDPADFRRLTGVNHSAIRCSHKLMAVPPGYVKTGDLANDPIIKSTNPPFNHKHYE